MCTDRDLYVTVHSYDPVVVQVCFLFFGFFFIYFFSFFFSAIVWRLYWIWSLCRRYLLFPFLSSLIIFSFSFSPLSLETQPSCGTVQARISEVGCYSFLDETQGSSCYYCFYLSLFENSLTLTPPLFYRGM